MGTLQRVIYCVGDGLCTQPYRRLATGGWSATYPMVYGSPASVHRVTVEEDNVRAATVVHAVGFTTWSFASSRRRLHWTTATAALQSAPPFFAFDVDPAAPTLASFSVKHATRCLRRAAGDGTFVRRGRELAAAIGTPAESLPLIARVTANAPWAFSTRNWGYELAMGCALVGASAGAPSHECAGCTQFGVYQVASLVHVLTTCEVVTALREWAIPLLLTLLGLEESDVSAAPHTPFSAMGFARMLAHGGDDDMIRHPACMAVRGACLSAMTEARNDSHARHDDAADRAQRRRETDDIDIALGVLPALYTAADVGGWSHERVIAHAKRDLLAHVTTDLFCALGAYHVHPDCAQIKTHRPQSRQQLIDLWGSICDFPEARLAALGAKAILRV